MGDHIVFFFQLASSGDVKVEIDPGIWQNLEGQITIVWLSDHGSHEASVIEEAVEAYTPKLFVTTRRARFLSRLARIVSWNRR